MEKPKAFVSRLKPPTVTPNSIKPPMRILQAVPNTSHNEEPILKLPPARRILARRSKSYSEINKLNRAMTENKPTVPFSRQLTSTVKSKFTSTKTAALIPNHGVTKRPATTQNNEPAPAKVPKFAKPAPYDYKARFNILKDQHTSLVKTHKEVQEQLLVVTNELDIKKCFEEKYEGLLEKHDKTKQENNELHLEVTKMGREIEVLRLKSKELDRIKENHLNLTTKFENISYALEQTIAARDNFEKESLELKAMIQKHEENRREMHNTIQDLKGNIRVFCRIRPTIQDEDFKILGSINCLDENTVELYKTTQGRICDSRLEFTFDKVFSPDATQRQVFEELSLLVQSALDGYNVCVFAYGQTGSGKTYTMQGGSDEASCGMIPRTIGLIFDLKEQLEKIGWSYNVEVSFLEIYNETIKDLLQQNSNIQHDIRFNQGHGTTVTNLTVKDVKSPEELRYYMMMANKNRATAATNYNQHSSRSHAVTKIILTGQNEEMKLNYVGSINLVDLAGSENPKNSERITETKNINKSLSTLGTVMSALHNRDSHIPYRNSKLTFLLQSCLGGNSKTLMFVNIAPFEECYTESVNALRFAFKVKDVKLGSKRNFTK